MTDPYTPKPMDAATMVLEALDAERARIGREIHDGPAQALTNAIFEVDDIERLVERDPAGAMVGLRQLRALLRRELANVREFISELRPPTVDAAGLDVAIIDAVDGLRSATRIGVTTDCAGRAISRRPSTDGHPARRAGGPTERSQARQCLDRHGQHRRERRRMDHGDPRRRSWLRYGIGGRSRSPQLRHAGHAGAR